MTAAAETAGGDADAAAVPTADADADETVESGGKPTSEQWIVADRETDRWLGIGALAFLAGGLGVIVGDGIAGLLLVAAVGVTYAAYARTARPPAAELHVERSVEPSDPDVDETVEVTVTVRNVGDGALPDLRIVDGVPSALAVENGTPRHGAVLRSGGETTFSYTVTAERGVHEFEPTTVYARDASGAVERELAVTAPTAIECLPRLEGVGEIPLRAKTSQYAGRVTTDTGGEGVEFHSVREYRSGDPVNRIDWNTRARTGELATLEFREERSASVVLLVDSREAAYRTSGPDAGNAVERSLHAAGAVFDSLLDSGDQVGIAALSPTDGWLAPGSGREQRVRARRMLATHPAFSPSPPDERFFRSLWRRKIEQRLPESAQVVLFSPLCDDYPAQEARRLDALGHPVTVVSPDVTATDTVGRRLAAVERTLRCSRLRESGVRVIDWPEEESLALALRRADARWSG